MAVKNPDLNRAEINALCALLPLGDARVDDTWRSVLDGAYRKLEAALDTDPHGELNPEWNGSSPRFVIYDAPGYNASEQDGWRYQLTLVDHKFVDSDSAPISSHPHGNTREEAYACAAEYVQRATVSEECVF